MKKKVPVTAMFTPQALDRLAFLMEHYDTTTHDDVIHKALHYLDRAICATAEGGRPFIAEKDGRIEEFTP